MWLDLGEESSEEMEAAIEQRVKCASINCLSTDGCSSLGNVLSEYRDILLLQLGSYPPADVEPIPIFLKENMKPVITLPRRYSTE